MDRALGPAGWPTLKDRVVKEASEVYNLLNSVQFDLIDNTARFDASGAQVNQNFGKATRARNARIMQGALRLVF